LRDLRATEIFQTRQENETFHNEGTYPTFLSIVIPTYNERENIINLVREIVDRVPKDISTEILIVDDNSPDGTGFLVDKFVLDNNSELIYNESRTVTLKVIHRQRRDGLICAVLDGIQASRGKNILVMDADFSHPPQLIPRIINELKHESNCVVIGSRYAKGGTTVGVPLKRLLISFGATGIARYGLNVKEVRDPMSGFFALPRHVLKDIEINTQGFKILLEILVKKQRHVTVKEIPYTFTVRKYGHSKLDLGVTVDYSKAIWSLYKYGRRSRQRLESSEHRRSVLFLSKAARFFTVGASGLLINFLVSFLLSDGTLANLWYVQATAIGIAVSITTNFLLNKIWTFEDKQLSVLYTLKQYSLFLFFSSLGISIQLSLVYLMVESGMSYNISLICAVAAASISNFVLNKKWTFGEKVWG
jgi:dolichol-phosphate mannosyltransferase